MKDPGVSWAYHNALWTMGTTNPEETLKAFSRYKLVQRTPRRNVVQTASVVNSGLIHCLNLSPAAKPEWG